MSLKETFAARQMALIVLAAVKTREEAYDHLAADEATAAMDRAEAEHMEKTPDKQFYRTVDYKKFYTISLETACDKEAELAGCEGLGRIVYLALDGWWNDTIEWANQVLDPTATTAPTSKHCQHGVFYSDDLIGDEQIEAPVDLTKPHCPLCSAFMKRLI